MKKRVLIFSIAYEPLIGGAELAVKNITDRIKDFEFDLITCRFSPRHKALEKIGNVNVYRVGFGSRLGRYLYPAFAFRLAKKLYRQSPYNVVWSIMAAYAGAASLLFLRRFPDVKFFLTLQEGDAISHIHKKVRHFTKKWQQIFKKADYIQAISNYLASWAKKEGATCPIEVVPNGVTPFVFSPLLRGRLRGGGITKIITISRLVPKNGIDVLIRAIAVIAIRRSGAEAEKQFQDIKLQILGSGPEEKSLKKLVRALKIDDVVEFLGNVSYDKIPEYLSQSDIFVRPSRSEGLGSAFLEAMAAGLPIIGTEVGGIPDFLTTPLIPPLTKGGNEGGWNANGLFCKVDDSKDLAEKIKFLIENNDLRIQLGRNGRKLVEEKYDWDIIAKKIQTIFEKLCIKK